MDRLIEKPYIGVTGINLPRHAQAVSRTFEEAGLTQEQSHHRGMVGLLVSQKTLSTRFSTTSRYPNLEQIRQILTITQNTAFNTLHYHTYRRSTLALQLKELLGSSGLYADGLCEGVQLNVSWPPVSEVERIKQTFPDLKIIMQLGPKTLTESPSKVATDLIPSAEEIVANLAPYADLVSYVLIDPSGGRGQAFQINRIAPIANQINKTYPDLPLVFAGGFDATNARRRLWVLFQSIGTVDFSIDAQGGLSTHHKDQRLPNRFNISKACNYIQNAALFFKKYAHQNH